MAVIMISAAADPTTRIWSPIARPRDSCPRLSCRQRASSGSSAG